MKEIVKYCRFFFIDNDQNLDCHLCYVDETTLDHDTLIFIELFDFYRTLIRGYSCVNTFGFDDYYG